jgi:hypothetical protein
MNTVNLSKYFTDASAVVGLFLTLLTSVNGLGGLIPSSAQHYVATAVAVLTWVAVNVFHRKAVAAAAAAPKK